ncbi:hypothetical protein [Hydrogenophaga sp. PAMC20947]|uniref:hypothetical protein n=1 Tax=Hydrogenophaga sp. PAMC20947 TaxID=2565558 RepID=UPI00109DD0B2|nr:hypothetical protein [Hydrogenophaga sp. PAMC20947]QCB46891.1 hypothetical protein E5678_13180 [Hydrogenophaga sp. PAMC20947]
MTPFAAWILAQEARALMTRLARVQPFALLEPMVPAAALMPRAQVAIERHLALGRRDLERMVQGFLAWLRGAGRSGSAAQAQRRFTHLRLQFNAALTQFDLFSDVITQRSEHASGVWLSGLDVVAADALTLPGRYFDLPPIICYLDRGAGAAIRRARTRLPGGGENPVAVIRVPRERMVGSGIASSLVHEVGHQASALLDLVASLRPVLRGMQAVDGPDRSAWMLWERWISEIVADFWAIARVGIASTLGLIAVVSLPRAFVFRMESQDPHPAPWIRVMLSCAIGQALYPHPQWARFAALWEAFYPPQGLEAARAQLLMRLRATMPAFVALLVQHRPRSLHGRRLVDVLATEERQPLHLARLYRAWCETPAAMYRAAPSLVFAVIGQARANGRMSPELESELLARLLTHWALESSLKGAAQCANVSSISG